MKGKLEQFIDSHLEEFDHRTPDPKVLERLQLQMAIVNPPRKKGLVISFKTLGWVAAACILIACGMVLWKLQDKPVEQPIVVKPVVGEDVLRDTVTIPAPVSAKTETESIAAVDQDITIRKKRVMASLNQYPERAFKQVLFKKLDNDDSPAGRIQAVSQTQKLSNLSNDVVDVLAETMNNDPNTNVRLAALDGLAKFYRDPYVRRKLVAALPKQHDPMVQIALIKLLTRLKESAIISELESLIKDENAMDAVKETAYTGAHQLKTL